MTTATPATRKSRRELTPVDVTKRFPAFRSGRMEAWAAESRDGIWRYARLEITGTPWTVLHVPTGIESHWYGTLTAAREGTANGSALACVERVQSHERGGHDAERDPRCPRC